VQRFLGHEDFATTQKWYLHEFAAPTYALSMSDFAPTLANVVPFTKKANEKA
jgi:hypothetical protein